MNEPCFREEEPEVDAYALNGDSGKKCRQG